jgi:hypothetical protein
LEANKSINKGKTGDEKQIAVGWMKYDNEEPQNLYSSPNIITVIK